MKSYLWLAVGVLMVIWFSGCPTFIDDMGGTNYITLPPPPPSGQTFGLYSETVPISVTWDTDAKMFVWQEYDANAALSDDGINPAEGTKSLRMRCISTNLLNPWFGVGFSVWPLTANKNLTNYNYLNFMYKGTKNFKIGIKDGFGDEAWLTAPQMFTNGCVTNGTWCTVKISLATFDIITELDYRYVNQYFMFCSDFPLGCASNDIHWIDHVYYSEE